MAKGELTRITAFRGDVLDVRCTRAGRKLLDGERRVFEHAQVIGGIKAPAECGRIDGLDRLDQFVGQQVDMVFDGKHDTVASGAAGGIAQ